MQSSVALALFALFLIVTADYDPKRFQAFLLANRQKQCGDDSGQPRIPLSYYVPPGYFDGIPEDQRVSPANKAKAAERVPACDNMMVQPSDLDQYTFETEKFISIGGLNIYDGATWAIALAILGEQATARQYQTGVVMNGKTCQFKNIRGDSACKGVILQGQCSDPNQAGVCGFCYGESTTQPFANAWSFRAITDYWALQGTVDLRCPDQGHPWIWNDYKPVLGENAWSNILAPLQVATIAFGSINAIPADDMAFKLALNFVQSLSSMVEAQTGGIYYSPKNTLLDPHTDAGFNLSVENNSSLLAGLKALLHIFRIRNLYNEWVPQIISLITGIEKFIKASYDPSLQYFRQGGTVVNGNFQWNNLFSVDCQTWLMSVVGPRKINGWFGAGTAELVWNTTKKMGGYHYTVWDNSVEGLGFTNNGEDQCFSGEWSAGGINMLRIFAAELGDPKYTKEGENMRNQIEYKLTEDQTIDGINCRAVKYANKRYYIPFGWWANPLDSLASTTWSVFLDSQYNPFYLGGAYNSTY